MAAKLVLCIRRWKKMLWSIARRLGSRYDALITGRIVAEGEQQEYGKKEQVVAEVAQKRHSICM